MEDSEYQKLLYLRDSKQTPSLKQDGQTSKHNSKNKDFERSRTKHAEIPNKRTISVQKSNKWSASVR